MYYSTQITPYLRAWTMDGWDKYGLSTKHPKPLSECKEHNLVTAWLDSHPEDVENYLNKMPGYGYLDILLKAEKSEAKS